MNKQFLATFPLDMLSLPEHVHCTNHLDKSFAGSFTTTSSLLTLHLLYLLRINVFYQGWRNRSPTPSRGLLQEQRFQFNVVFLLAFI